MKKYMIDRCYARLKRLQIGQKRTIYISASNGFQDSLAGIIRSFVPKENVHHVVGKYGNDVGYDQFVMDVLAASCKITRDEYMTKINAENIAVKYDLPIHKNHAELLRDHKHRVFGTASW